MASLPSSELVAVDGNGGSLPNDPAQTQVKVGSAVTGTVLSLEYPNDKTALTAEYTSGPMPESAGQAMDELGHGPVGTVRCAASTAGVAGSVTKTDPSGSVGTALVTPGSFVLAGADTDGDLLVTEKDVSGIYTLTTVVGGSLGFSITGLVATLTVTTSTTAAAAEAYFNAQSTAFAKFSLRALGAGTSVCVQASGPTSAANGRLSVTALIPGQSLAVVVPNSATASLTSSYVAPLVSISSATDAKKKPTTTAALAFANLAALAASNPGVFSIASTSGSLFPGAMANTALPFGSTGAVALSGTPYDAYRVRVAMTVPGALGVAQFILSLDGGITYTAAYITPAGGVFVIPGTGLTLTFSGIFALDLFDATCTAPDVTLSDITAALDYLLVVSDSFALLHIVGEVSIASLPTYHAAIGTYADQFEAAHKYLRIAIEVAPPAVGQTNAAWEGILRTAMASLQHARIGIYGMTGDAAASIPGPQRSRIMRRNSAWSIMARAGAFPVGRDVGDQTYGKPLSGIVKVYELDQAANLARDRVSCFYSLVGVAGFHGQALLTDSLTGDYQYLVYGRLIDEVCRIGYAYQTTLLNSAARRRTVPQGPYPAGAIDPGAALAIEHFLGSKLNEALVGTGQCTSIVVTVNRTNTTDILDLKYDAVPLDYFRRIRGKAGLVLSAQQTF